MYDQLEVKTATIKSFLVNSGFDSNEISVSPPMVNDKKAQNYANYSTNDIRFSASQTVTIYSLKIDTVISAQNSLVALGKQGLVLSGDGYSSRTQFLYSGLNEIKPTMIEDATQKAREVALKFAEDSGSKLGKIKQARQGQFTIGDRDSNTPHVKRVRVVATIEYYLID
ncbi:SIMPL domain-containing protein [Aliiglaciecola sp. LCG003]|uniref:SIMPL domain-containing protein n=1 Tax=Aliiglaciecola sp. LCG003 TaxID=3053655 RepID=UPI00336542A3